MLGTRTKHVLSYGKRGHRIINVDERERKKPIEIITVSDDIESSPLNRVSPLPQMKPARKKRRENLVLSPTPSPQMARVKKSKKRLSESKKLECANRRPIRVKQLIESEVRETLDLTSPSRTPLGQFHPNVPGTPAQSGSHIHLRRKKTIRQKGSPLSISKPFSPFVDMDIILLDDKGRRISRERRVSRTDVQVNHITEHPARLDTGKHKAADNIVLVVSDGEESSPFFPVKRMRKKTPAVLISSDESETESQDCAAVNSYPRLKPLQVRPSQRRLEVVVPPLPYSSTKIRTLVAPQNLHSLPPAKHDISHSPKPRARQLTPIRRGCHGRQLFQPPSPPSPFTPTDMDLDLSIELANLQLSLSQTTPHHLPAYLIPLLDACMQDSPHEFSAFIESFPFDPIVRTPADICTRFRKIGEASYSEVYGIGEVVLKIIPLRDESGITVNTEVEGPSPSDVKDVLNEVIVTRAMGDICEGFVKLLRAYVVKGRYPELLLSLWDEYDARKGSEGIRPDTFPVAQTYAIIVLPNGGPDLEAYTFTNAPKTGWRQACSLFWQVARALADAEELVKFEHRDLHWGQILVKNMSCPSDVKRKIPKKKRVSMDDESHGVRATVIDLGLARMDAESEDEGVRWTPFDDEIFEGEGDYQFDVYRMMRECHGREWEGFKPITNVMWLHYLTQKLLYSKHLRPPRSQSSARLTASGGFNERECYECLVELETVLSGCVDTVKKAVSRKGRRKTVAKSASGLRKGPESGRDVVSYGVSKGWITTVVS